MTDRNFTYQAAAARVVFGRGTLAMVADEAARLDIGRALVLSTPQQADLGAQVRELLGDRAGGLFSDATMHTPVAVTEAAMGVVAEAAVDGLIAIGGGSTTGLGKALALRTGLPVIAVPTTYAGSEMTPILGETSGGEKRTLRDPRVLPRTVIYDVDLTVGLPPLVSAMSGINAMAHAVEALYACDRNPVTDLLAEDGARAMMAALPRIVADPRDRSGRQDALYAAWLCGTCLAQTEMGLHHKLCHTLGGSFDLPHAETHAVMLPHTLAYNSGEAPEAVGRLARAFGAADPAARLFDLLGAVGGPVGLKDLGMPHDGLARALDLALGKPYPNPRPLERDALARLLERAWAGSPPARD